MFPIDDKNIMEYKYAGGYRKWMGQQIKHSELCQDVWLEYSLHQDIIYIYIHMYIYIYMCVFVCLRFPNKGSIMYIEQSCTTKNNLVSIDNITGGCSG